jgi:hypothetical protein
MLDRCIGALLLLLLSVLSFAQAKQPIISFGKPTPVKWMIGPEEQQSLEMTVRPLYVNGRLREFTTGEPHDVTDRLFVVRRAFRVNDRLPEEPKKMPIWRWQRGGWLRVDRVTGNVRELTLPDFDPYYSTTSWYRDYAAYCGMSEDGEKVFAVVAQVGQRKPVVRGDFGRARSQPQPDSECSAPRWERTLRVTFEAEGKQPVTLDVQRQAVVTESVASEPSTKQE